MKKLLFTLVVALLPILAQTSPTTIQNFAAAGVSYNPGAVPAVAGTGLYARLMTGGTWAFTAVDALPINYKPFEVTTQFSAGVAQKLPFGGPIQIFIPTSAGISYSGTNTGWAWTTGALALVPLGKTWRLAPNVRVVKSSINDGQGYQVIGGVLLGWGW